VYITMYPNPHPPGCPWHSWGEVFGAPNVKWCEATACAWISEPINAWSNVAYVIAAAPVFWQCRRSPHLELRALAPLLLLTGVCSFLYHASNIYLTQIIDFLGMFCFVFWLLAINLRRCGWINASSQRPVHALLVVVHLGVMHAMHVQRYKFQLLVLGAIVGVVATEIRAQARGAPAERVGWQQLGVALALLCLAQLCSMVDILRWACDPAHPFLHGHAAWHLLSAAALYFGCQHYRRLTFAHAS
jgi:hypothetical protein